MKRRTVTIRVPASTSNLGSGFDTLGLALNLYTVVRITRLPGLGVALASPVEAADRAGAEAVVRRAANLFFRQTGTPPFRIAISASGNVPIARGLGYSAQIRLGVVAALNELTRAGLDRSQLVGLVARLEGHPDNASPAVFGGFTVAGFVGDRVPCLHFSVNRHLKCVTLIPRFKISTRQARTLLPQAYAKTDTAHALNRAALIVAAFASRDYPSLRGLFDDRLHQPYRERLIPQLSRVIRAGERAGAIGGFLSGSGSAIICLTLGHPDRVARAMQRQLPDSEVEILIPDNQGFKIIRERPGIAEA
jgi:homoserine kinase